MACNSPMYILDKFERWQPVPCGKCWACRADYVENWRARLSFEMQGKQSVMVTLTYNDDCLVDNKQISKDEMQRYIKRLRKDLDGRKNFKYFLSGEYGDNDNTFRPHYHLMLLGLSYADKPIIEKAWGKGFVTVKPCNADACKYILKYILKQKDPKSEINQLCDDKGYQKPFLLMSKGIGKLYMLTHFDTLRKDGGYYDKGKLKPLPRYYRNGLHIVSRLHTTNKQDKQIKDYMQQHNCSVITARYALGQPNEIEAEGKNKLFEQRGIYYGKI